MAHEFREMCPPVAVAAVVVGLGLFAVSTQALAQSPRSFPSGGFAGPVDDSARVVGTNPSAMGMIDGTSIDLHHTLQLRSQTFEADDRSADMFLMQSDPLVAFASDLGSEYFHAGFIGGVPRRYGSSWPSDGPQRYDSIFHRVRDIELTAAGSLSPADWFHFGASVSFIQAEYRSYSAVDMGPIVARQEEVDPDTVPRRHPGNEGRQFLDFSGRTVGWTAGVTLTPGDFRIGAAYHGSVPLRLDGSYELYIPRNDYYEGRYGGDINREATLETRWPGRLTAGVGWNFGSRTELFAHAGWTRWSAVDDIVVDVEKGDSSRSFDRREKLDLHDSFDLRIGGITRLMPWLAIDATIGAESSAIPTRALTAKVLETPKAFAAAGARMAIAENVSLRAGYQHVHYFRTSSDPGADQPGTPGEYAQTLGLLETSLSIQFP